MSQDDEFDFESVDWDALEHTFEGSEGTAGQQIISRGQLAKRLLWDTVPCEIAVPAAALMGMSPASEDVEEMEHRESHRRMVQAAPVVPYLRGMAFDTAKAVMAAQYVAHEVETDQEELNEAAAKMSIIVYQSTLAILANLLDVGALHFPHITLVARQ